MQSSDWTIAVTITGFCPAARLEPPVIGARRVGVGIDLLYLAEVEQLLGDEMVVRSLVSYRFI